MIISLIGWFLVGVVCVKVLVKGIRLMEIKERQLGFEQHNSIRMYHIEMLLTDILKVLKGRKDGRRKGKKIN